MSNEPGAQETCPICGSKYMMVNWRGRARFCLDCDRDIPDHVVQAIALQRALGTIAAKVRADSDANPGEPTSAELAFEHGEWVASLTWWHHDGPIDEQEGRSTESHEAAIIALAAKLDAQDAKWPRKDGAQARNANE